MPVTKSIRWNVSCELKDCKSEDGYIFDKCTKSEFHRLIKKKGWAVINMDSESQNVYLCPDCKIVNKF